MSSDLAVALARAEKAKVAFVCGCQAYGFADEFAAYKADARGEAWPAPLSGLHRNYVTKLHEFYRLRDGQHGWLGGRERAATPSNTPDKG